jgi:hypothetical protein
MSEDNFWENEDVMDQEQADSVFFSDPYAEEEYEMKNPNDTQEDSESDLEVLKNARLRLEQGKLYEMLLKHNLFEGVEAEQRAINNVQREIRSFIKERLEILVGLKPDPRLKRVETGLEMFSGVELQVLKEFVGRVTKTKEPQSPHSESNQNTRPTGGGIKPVSGGNNVRVNPVKASAPQKQKRQTEDTAPGLTKPPSQMTIQELKEYNKSLSARQARRKAAPPAKKLPMPDAEQLNTLYATRVQSDPGQGLVGAIMSKMGKTVTMIENVGDGGVEDSSNDSRI